MERICPNCGAKNPNDAIYCMNCGLPLETVKDLRPPINSLHRKNELINAAEHLRAIHYKDPLSQVIFVIGVSIIIVSLLILALLPLYSIFSRPPMIQYFMFMIAIFFAPIIASARWFVSLNFDLKHHNLKSGALHNAEIELLQSKNIYVLQLPPLSIRNITPLIRVVLLLIPFVNIIALYFLVRDIHDHIDHHKNYYTSMAFILGRYGMIQEAQIMNLEMGKITNIDKLLAILLSVAIYPVGLLYVLYKTQELMNKMINFHMLVVSILVKN